MNFAFGPENRRRDTRKLSSMVAAVIGVVSTLALTSCTPPPPPEPGYRELPNPCDLVRPQMAVRLVGGGEPQLSGYDPPDHDAGSGFGTQNCEWRNVDPHAVPRWGSIAFVTLRVETLISLSGNGSPDLQPAKTSSAGEFQDKRMHVLPPDQRLGDQSGQFYDEPSGVQLAVCYFRRANVEVKVFYQGMGNNSDGSEVHRPPEELEKAAHDVAAEALQRLGPPR